MAVRTSGPDLAQERQHVLADRVGLLKMGMARQNELVEPELVIFGNPLRHLLMAADECSPGPRADQTDAGPQIRTDLEVAAVSAVQRQHPLLPDRFTLGEKLLRSRH